MDQVMRTAPVSDVYKDQAGILSMIESGPIVLMQRSQPAGVFVHTDEWNATARLIDDLREQLDRERRLRLSNQRYAAFLVDPTRGVEQAEYEEGLAAAGLDT